MRYRNRQPKFDGDGEPGDVVEVEIVDCGDGIKALYVSANGMILLALGNLETVNVNRRDGAA